MASKLEDVVFRSGDLFLPKSVRQFLEQYWIGNNRSLFYVNNWSFVHFLSGVISVFLFDTLKITQNTILYALVLHTIWELWQMIGKNTKYWTRRGQLDILVDTIFYMTGFITTEGFYKK